MIEQMIQEERFHFISPDYKQFICEFTNELEHMGYTFNNTIGSGICWGKYMIIYTKANVKSKQVVARIYIREDGIVLRLFLNKVSKHSEYISKTPGYIKDVFIGPYGDCQHCKGDYCKFRKDYTINGVNYEKCNGRTFEFYQPDMSRLKEYIGLFQNFYPQKKMDIRGS